MKLENCTVELNEKKGELLIYERGIFSIGIIGLKGHFSTSFTPTPLYSRLNIRVTQLEHVGWDEKKP